MATTVRNRDTDVVRHALLRRANYRFRYVFAVLALALVVAACSEDEPEVTMAERLASVEGRELTAAELADRLAVGDALCGMGDDVLDGVWRQLNERQLNFQDVVFGQICPDRSVFYASRTGRYVTEEATESGVSPNTTRPPITTAPAETTPASTETTDNDATTNSTSTLAATTSVTTADEATTETTESTVADESSTTVTPSGPSTTIATNTASSTTAATTSVPVSTTTAEGEGG